MKFHERICTGRQQMPWSGVFLLSLIWFSFVFHMFAGGQALLFLVKRYHSDPRVISLVMTLNVIIMLGPFISYISDQVWTPWGRRRPFVITAWAAACVGMFSFAFISPISAVMNHGLAWAGIPPVGEFVLLVAIVVGYTTFYDFSAPLEPLFLESVPPHQRGRFWAIRGILGSLAITTFYQVLWPLYDDKVDMFSWLGWPGIWLLRGDQMIFLLAGAMFFVTGLLVLFNIHEVPVANAPNKRFRELGIGRFVVKYFKDVFLTRSNYAFYIVLVIPSLDGMVWGGFGALMQNDQFGYSKANQALWAFPMQLTSMLILTPFAGWYSDVKAHISRWWRAGIVLASLYALGTAVWMYQRWAPVDFRDLPPFWVISVLTLLVAGGTAGLFVVIVEEMLDRVGREHTRAWVSLLTVFVHFAVTLVTFLCIRHTEDRVIPITLWLCFNVSNSAFGALLGTFVGPMIFEYIPRNKLGTIASGKGIYNDSLKFLIANLGAWWVWWYSTRIYHPRQSSYDYSSIYLLQFALMLPALAAKFFFLRQVVTGRIKKWGVMEVEGCDDSPVSAKNKNG